MLPAGVGGGAYDGRMPTIPEMPVWAIDEVEGYLGRLRSQRRLSSHTLAAYRRDLAQFFSFCHRAGVGSIDEVDRLQVRRYLAFLDTRGYARSSIVRRNAAAKACGLSGW